MADREKVIKGLEMHKTGLCNVLTENGKVYCPYWENNDNCMVALLNDALSLPKAQDAGWISADNRPPSQGRYFVYGLTNFVPDHIDQPNAYWEVKIAHWSNGFGWDCKVKYWIPLPEPPKEEQ